MSFSPFENLVQLNGTTVDTNSGNKSAGTLRVVLATDQPQNTTALKVDGSAVVQPVSAASLPLPSGASTSAKQPALGTAGTASADVITVQGIASMTALKVDGSAVVQPVSGTVAVSNSFALDASVTGLQVAQASTTSGQKGGLILGAVTTAAPTYTTAQTSPVSLTTAGAVRVDGSAVTQPVSGTVTTTPPSHASTNVDQFNGTTTDTNSGTKSAGTLRVVIATDQPQLTNKLLVTPDANSAVNVAQINGVTPLMGNGTTGTGSQRVTIASDNTAFSVNTTAKSATSGGLGLPFSASVNATKQQVKGSAGQVYGWSILNTTSAIAYCQVFNLASASVTVGTTTPDYVIPIPANGTTGAGNNMLGEIGIAHGTGITVCCTTTRTGSTNAACDVLFFFN